MVKYILFEDSYQFKPINSKFTSAAVACVNNIECFSLNYFYWIIQKFATCAAEVRMTWKYLQGSHIA